MTAPDPRPIPPPPWRCSTPGCPEPVTSWALSDWGGRCSEGCGEEYETPPPPEVVALCPTCLATIGGAHGGPDARHRAAEDFEPCGAADCPDAELARLSGLPDPYVCRKCGEEDVRTIERGETSAPVDLALYGPGTLYASAYPFGIGDSSTDWETLGACCGSCGAECYEGPGTAEAPTLSECFSRLFVLKSRRAPEVKP